MKEYIVKLQIIYLFETDSKFRTKLYEKYKDLIEAIGSKEYKMNTILENKEVYKVLCNETLYLIAFYETRRLHEAYNVLKDSEDAIKFLGSDASSIVDSMKSIRNKLGYNGESVSTEDCLSAANADIKFNEPIEIEDAETEQESVKSDVPNGFDMLNMDSDDDDDFKYTINCTTESDTTSDNIDKQGEEVVEPKTDYGNNQNVATDSQLGRIDSLDDESTSEDEEEVDVSNIQCSEDVDEIIIAIMNRNEAVFRTCLEMDRPYGMLYDKGLLSYNITDGRVGYKPGVGRGTSVFEK
jgi:hypothetical protein